MLFKEILLKKEMLCIQITFCPDFLVQQHYN